MTAAALYASALVWYGVWKTPTGLTFLGYHIWNQQGEWRGVYQSHVRARVEAQCA